MGRVPRVYLDACALNRLTDPPSHLRIELEAAAVEQVLLLVRAGKMLWISSSILGVEIGKNPNKQRRAAAFSLLGLASEMQFLTPSIVIRGKRLSRLGLDKFDALHLAVAEESRCDVVFTTDDRFEKWSDRNFGASSVRVENPLDYLKTV
jgi:hypothetical protein